MQYVKTLAGRLSSHKYTLVTCGQLANMLIDASTDAFLLNVTTRENVVVLHTILFSPIRRRDCIPSV